MNPLLLPEIRGMLAENDTDGIRAMVEELHPASTAEFAEGLLVEEIWQVLNHAPIPRQAEIFPFFSLDKQKELVSGVGRERISKLLEAMSHDDRVDLLQHLDADVTESLLPLVAKADREDIRLLLSYPEHSAGSVMTTDYASLVPELTVQDALNQLRQQAPHRETIYYIYVIDKERHLIGFVSLRDLILASPKALIRDIMQEEIVSVQVDQDQEEVAQELAYYDFLAMPVVDAQQRLVGIVTHDDVADVFEDEATEDFHLGAAVKPLTHGYSQTSIWALYQRRVGWLVILVFVNLVSSGVISAYEETLQATIALAFFLPLLIDSGGNTGSQAATLIVRALATDEVSLGGWLKVIRKELFVGLTLGGTMAIASFLLGSLRGGWGVGMVVGLSMLGIVLVTNLIGVMLPFILTRLKFDPAVASSPLITTVADATGLLLYFSIANLILGTT